MRRIAALLIVFTLALPAGGCQFFKNIETFVQLGTASITNPVTPKRLDQMQQATIVVFTGLNAWRDSCEQGLIPKSCYDQIESVQVYTRQIKPFLEQLRKFVRNNDQVNATVVWNQVIDIIGIVKGRAAENGVTIGGPT